MNRMTAVRNADEKGVKTGVRTIKGAFGRETRQKEKPSKPYASTVSLW